MGPVCGVRGAVCCACMYVVLMGHWQGQSCKVVHDEAADRISMQTVRGQLRPLLCIAMQARGRCELLSAATSMQRLLQIATQRSPQKRN